MRSISKLNAGKQAVNHMNNVSTNPGMQLIKQMLKRYGANLTNAQLEELAKNEASLDLFDQLVGAFARMQLEERALFEQEPPFPDFSREIKNYADKHGV